MVYAIAWNETDVSDETYGYDLDEKINNTLKAVRERFEEEHRAPTGASGLAYGMHEWNVVAKSTGSPYTVLETDHAILVTTGASNYELDLPTAVGITGKPYKIKKVDSGVGKVIIDPNGSETIDGGAGVALLNQHDYVEIVSDGTNWIITASNFALRDVCPPPTRLVIKQASVATVDVDADEIFVPGAPKAAVDITITITASGANGLDTGSEANSTYYFIWLIYNPETGTYAGLFSVSESAPTMPTGYTKKRFIGVCLNDSVGNILNFHQVNETFAWRDPFGKEVDDGGSTSTTTKALSYVPNTLKVKSVWGKVINNYAGADTLYMSANSFANSTAVDNSYVECQLAFAAQNHSAVWKVENLLVARTIYYQVVNGTKDIWTCGFQWNKI